MKKTRIFCGTKQQQQLKNQVKKYKRKKSSWINNDKSAYTREDLPNKIIPYTF